MTGYIRKRSSSKGLITYQLILDKGEVKGKRFREYFSYPTKKQAEQAKAEKLNQLNQGTYVEPSKKTVNQLLNEWLTTVTNKLAPNTIRGYKLNIEHHTVPYIGDIPLQKLTPVDIQNMYSSLQEAELSPRSIKYIHTTLREALQYALKMGYIFRNVADFVSLPKQKKYVAEVYNEEESLELLKSAEHTDMEIPIILAVGLGLRRGEILALRWSDIDIKANTISVKKNLVCVEGKLIFSSPKTQSSVRTISAPVYVINKLKQHRTKQLERRIAIGSAYQNNDLVYCKADGTPINPSSFSLKFKRFLDTNKMKHIRFHDLRHTCATLMLKYGVPAKVASQRLGHANINITLDTYSHVLKDVESTAAEKFEENLFQKIG